MLDIQLLRNNIDALAERLATRGFARQIGFPDARKRAQDLQTRTQELQASRNSLSKQVGMLKGRGEDAAPVDGAGGGAEETNSKPTKSASASCSRNSTPFSRCCPICRRTACRSANRKPTTSKSSAGGRRAALTLRSRIMSTSAKRSASSISPPPRKSPARAFR
jgi:hypothetical protein